MSAKCTESCGRCGISSIVDTDDEDGERAARDPFAGGHIEVDEAEMRLLAAPQVLAGRVKSRLDDVAMRLTYGSR